MRLGMREGLGWSLLLLAVGCGQQVTVSVSSGPIEFSVAASELGLPSEFEDGGRIASVPCMADRCPLASGSLPVELVCDADGTCDPLPAALDAPLGDVLDFDRLARDAKVGDLLVAVESIDIAQASWAIEENTLTFPLPPAEVYWGPASATRVDPDQGVVLLGTVPALGVGATGGGEVQLDPAGQQALSDHLVNVERRARFFLRTVVDVDPGDPFPAGSLRGSVRLKVVFGGPGL